MNIKVIKAVCLVCYIFFISQTSLSQSSLSQGLLPPEGLPQIELACISRMLFLSDKKNILCYGVETFNEGVYVDSLINYMDTICYVGLNKDSCLIYKAVWNKDTLTYIHYPAIRRTFEYDYNTKKKLNALEVESQIPPFNRYSVVTEGLDERTIAMLTDSMLRINPPSPILLNNYQTCVFYALEALFRSNNINTDPIITRNTNFEQGTELNAFFDHFFVLTETHPCRYKKLKGKTFPENSLLAFIDDYGRIIHTVFYQNGLFYSKNGMSAPVVVSDLKQILIKYGRWETRYDLNKTGKRMQGNVVAVYTLNKELFFNEEAETARLMPEDL